MTIRSTLIGFASVFIITTATISAKADMAAGNTLANTCYSCHGPKGVSSGTMPTLAGKSQKFIAETMKAYRSGKLKGTVMNRIAKGFTDAEIDSLSKNIGK